MNFDHDVVFTWNGTTSGARVPNGDWIKADRKGLAICDATSAAFAMDLPWDKLDVVTWSWQKVLGGEAQHGMLVLSPRAVERLESYSPPWPMPKIFRLTKGGKLQEPVFEGDTINTVSMLCVEDAVDGLTWAESVGGLKGLHRALGRADLKAHRGLGRRKSKCLEFLAEKPETRSCTSICLKKITAPIGSPVSLSARRSGRHAAKKLRPAFWRRKVWRSISAVIATRRRACASGAAQRSIRRISRRCCRGWNGRTANRCSQA